MGIGVVEERENGELGEGERNSIGEEKSNSNRQFLQNLFKIYTAVMWLTYVNEALARCTVFYLMQRIAPRSR